MEHGQLILAPNIFRVLCQCQRAHMGTPAAAHSLAPIPALAPPVPAPEATGHFSSPVPAVHGLSLASSAPAQELLPLIPGTEGMGMIQAAMRNELAAAGERITALQGIQYIVWLKGDMDSLGLLTGQSSFQLFFIWRAAAEADSYKMLNLILTCSTLYYNYCVSAWRLMFSTQYVQLIKVMYAHKPPYSCWLPGIHRYV